jgi:uncharacterized membrane protein YphA (DoxX/SURF4 family)
VNNRLRSAALQWALALVLGGIFLYASQSKIREPREFARIVYHYRLLGPSAALPHTVPNTLAVTLPWIEALTGVLLIVNVWRREAAILTALMLVVFIAAASYALAQGIDVENCGCFDVHGKGRGAGLTLIVEDLLMLGAAILLANSPNGRRSAPPQVGTAQ